MLNIEKVVGLKGIVKNIEKVQRAVEKNIMRNAVSQGLKPIMERAKSLAASNFKSNTIAKMIGKKAYLNKKKQIIGKVFVRPQPDRTVKLQGRDVPFEVVANVLEFGRKDGSLPARSYMRRARDEAGGKALQIVENEVQKGLKTYG
jgi:hypothetical protein